MHENGHEFSKEQETIQAEEQPKSSNLIGWANTSFFFYYYYHYFQPIDFV